MARELRGEIEPVPIRIAEPVSPEGHWLSRGVRALFIERRLPTQIADARDRLLSSTGFPQYRISIDDTEADATPARFNVRRCTADVFFVREVFRERAYNRSGYEIGPSDIVIDVGGNIGAFAIYAGRRARMGRVISFEPLTENYALLLENVRQNHLTNVTVVHGAVTGARETVTLYRSDDGTGSHSLFATHAGKSSHSEQIEATSIGDVLQRFKLPRCDFLKLDCEGAEYEIFALMTKDVAQAIRRVVLEYHTTPDSPKRAQSDELVGRLIALGFVIERYEDHLATNRGMIFARHAELPPMLQK